jgi:hypothetical protein
MPMMGKSAPEGSLGERDDEDTQRRDGRPKRSRPRCPWRASAGGVLAHVNFKNVGHLPAYDFKWHIDLTPSDQDEWKPPPVPDSDLRPSGVLPIGTTFKRGSKGIGVPSEKFIYAWGRVTYLDGSGKPRFTNFCHRCNTAVKDIPVGGGYRIRKKLARYHDHGNEAVVSAAKNRCAPVVPLAPGRQCKLLWPQETAGTS